MAFNATEFIDAPSVEKLSGLKKFELVDLVWHCELEVKPLKKAEVLALVLRNLVEKKLLSDTTFMLIQGDNVEL